MAIFNAPAKASSASPVVTVTPADLKLSATHLDVFELLNGTSQMGVGTVQASPISFDVAFFRVEVAGSGPAPAPAPGGIFRCENSKCVKSTSGGTQAECVKLCGPPPAPSKTDDRASSRGCSGAKDCSLNGDCKAGACACDPPWSGPSCGLLGTKPTPPGGAYRFGEKFATTSWGGNVLHAESKYHLYVTVIGGSRCGLGRWGNQSTVVHAVSDSVDGPFKKVATVVQHEAHNPQALEFEGSFYIFHIGSGASTTPIHDCDNDRAGTDVVEAPAPAVPMGSSLHKASSPAGPFLPVKQAGVGSCNNPSPFRHPNGTLFLVCTWSIKRADRPEGPWAEVMKLTPPPKNARHWEDPFLFIDARGFHILAHVYSMEAFPSNTISGLAFSESGLDWTWSEVEPYGNAVERTDGTVDHFATMERPKLLFADASNPTHPTHIINGVSPIWDTSNATDPCHECCPAPGGGGKTRCSCCKTYPGIDWTYTLLRPLKMDESVHSDGAGAPPPPPQKGPWFSQPFVSGVGGYHSYRIPAMVTLPQKMTTGEPELLAFCEGRKLSCDDVDWNDIVMRRSTRRSLLGSPDCCARRGHQQEARLHRQPFSSSCDEQARTRRHDRHAPGQRGV